MLRHGVKLNDRERKVEVFISWQSKVKSVFKRMYMDEISSNRFPRLTVKLGIFRLSSIIISRLRCN